MTITLDFASGFPLDEEPAVEAGLSEIGAIADISKINGTIDIQSAAISAAAENVPNITEVHYAAASAALTAQDSLEPSFLPAIQPLPSLSALGVPYTTLTYAQAQNLGFSTPTSLLGTITVSSDYALNLTPSSPPVSGELPLDKVVAHEVSEVLGRNIWTDNGPTLLADFAYQAPGVNWTYGDTAAAYFSVDGGQTPLAWFNAGSGAEPGDIADWLSNNSSQSGGTSDSFNDFVLSGQANGFSEADVLTLAVSGYEIISTSLACFTPGALITTPYGEKAVEHLKAGDFVLVQRDDGIFKEPITWTGRRTIDIRRHPEPYKVLPVLVMAGALAEMSPERDLLLSPDHAVYADGFLIPIKLLTNGKTITQLSQDRIIDGKVTYLHIELENHSIIYANGQPAESFLDTGNRNHFSNAGPVVKLHPIFGKSGDAAAQIREARIAAPLRLIGQEVDRVRQRTEERAIPILAQRSPKPLVLQLTL